MSYCPEPVNRLCTWSRGIKAADGINAAYKLTSGKEMILDDLGGPDVITLSP